MSALIALVFWGLAWLSVGTAIGWSWRSAWQEHRESQLRLLVFSDPDADHSRAYEAAIAQREEQRSE